jgi:DNA polymerase III epsilon subunit-like protein
MDPSYRDYGFTGFDKAVVLDIETTGLDARKDRIVSIACLRGNIADLATEGSTHLDQFMARLNPGVPIPRAATRVHGINDCDVAAEETFADIAIQLREFIGELPLIGHNISYDKSFLSHEFNRSGQKSLQRNKSYCTMKRLREHYGYLSGSWRNMSLDEAAGHFGLKRQGKTHDAMEDAMLALQLAGGLYELDNGLLPLHGQTHQHLQAPPARPRCAKANVVLMVIIFILVTVAVILLAL